MKGLSYALTVLSATILWLASLYATILLGWLIFCWQCGPEEGESIWLFWPLVYLIALAGAYLFSKLPDKYGGGNWGLAAVVMLILGAVFHFISSY